MIRYEKKTTGPLPEPKKAEDNGSEQVRRKATEKPKKDDTEGTGDRAQKTSEDSRLI